MKRHTQKFIKVLSDNAEDLIDSLSDPLAIIYEAIEKTLPSDLSEKDFFEAFESLENLGLQMVKEIKREVFYH